MQSSKEYQGEIRKPSLVINANKQKKTIEWERLEISSRKSKNSLLKKYFSIIPVLDFLLQILKPEKLSGAYFIISIQIHP